MNTNKEVDRIVEGWLEDRVVAPQLDGLREVIDQTAVTPQTRRRFLGRWLDRGRGVRRRTADHDHPHEVKRRNRLMLSATGIIAALAIVALSVNVIDTDPDPAPPSAGGTASHYVTADGSGDYDSIQAAVDAATDGETVFIAPGTYNESIMVERDLTIIGGGGPGSVVVRIPEDAPTGDFNEFKLRYGFWFQDVDAEIANLTIQGPGSGVSALVAVGGDLNAHGLVEDLDPYTNWPYGFLYIGGDAVGNIDSNTSKAFVWIDDEAAPTIRDNEIHNVIRSDGNSSPRILRNDVGGVWVRGSAAPIIEANDIDYANNGGADGGFSTCGIEAVEPDSRPTITDNTILNATTGICVAGNGEVEVVRNELAGNAIGIGLVRSEASVRDNTITGEGVGVNVSGVGSPSIVNNDIEVRGRGIAIGKTGTPKVFFNDVCGGEGDIVVVEGGTPEIGTNTTCGTAASE
jgi:hypothetical protein